MKNCETCNLSASAPVVTHIIVLAWFLIVIVARARTWGIALMEVFAAAGLHRRPFRVMIGYPRLQPRP